jgi:hypothetical protein
MNTMAAPAEISGLATKSKEEFIIINYIAGTLAFTILCAQISVATIASLTWPVYDVVLTANAEVRIAYYGLANA